MVDKTGTLTEGKPTVVAIVTASGFVENEVLRFAASVERASEHPLAAAIVAAATERKIELARVIGFDSPAGKGAVGMVDRRRVVLGNAAFLAELGISTAALDAEAERLRRDGATAIFVALDGKLAGVIAIADPVKETTPAALAALRRDGLRVVMLTGDNRTTAEAVARYLGIDEVEAEVLPDRKATVVERLRARGPRRRHGRRRRQRRAGARRRRRRHRHGHRHRRRDRERRTSRCSRATSWASSARAACRPRPCATSARTCSSPSSTTPPACRSRPACSIRCSALLLSPAIAAAAMALSSVSVVANALRLRKVEI